MRSTTLPSYSPSFPDRLLPLALLALLAVFPPECRGESQAGTAALLLLGTGLALGRLPPRPALAAIAVGVASLFPLLLVAVAPGAVPEPWAILLLAVAAGVVGAACRGEDEAWPALVLGVAGVVVTLHGLYQVGFGLESLAQRIEAEGGVANEALILARARGGRAFAGFSTPAALGGFLVLALPPTVGVALEASGRRRLWWLAAAAAQALGLLASRSATAVAGLIGALGIFVLIDPRTRRVARFAAIAAAALLVSIFVLRSGELLTPDAPASPWRLRAGNFRIAASMAGDHPWTGVGVGGYGEAYPQYQRPGDNATRHAHNLPLELAAELGLPLGACLSVVFAWMFVGPLVSTRSPSGPAARGVAVGLTALALQNLADFTAFLPSLLWSAALLRGWLTRATWSDEVRPASWGLRSLALVSVAVAAAVAGLAGLAWNERLAARHALASGNPGDAARRLERATRLAPWNIDGWLYLGQTRISSAGAAGTEARLSAERAVNLAPNRPAARALRARVRLVEDDLPGAFADALEAARLYPANPEYARARDDLERRFRAVSSAAPPGSVSPR